MLGICRPPSQPPDYLETWSPKQKQPLWRDFPAGVAEPRLHFIALIPECVLLVAQVHQEAFQNPHEVRKGAVWEGAGRDSTLLLAALLVRHVILHL